LGPNNLQDFGQKVDWVYHWVLDFKENGPLGHKMVTVWLGSTNFLLVAEDWL